MTKRGVRKRNFIHLKCMKMEWPKNNNRLRDHWHGDGVHPPAACCRNRNRIRCRQYTIGRFRERRIHDDIRFTAKTKKKKFYSIRHVNWIQTMFCRYIFCIRLSHGVSTVFFVCFHRLVFSTLAATCCAIRIAYTSCKPCQRPTAIGTKCTKKRVYCVFNDSSRRSWMFM